MSGARSLSGLLPGGGTPAGKAWLVTFTDLVCLMLTFFVMLYAMSEPDPKRFQALAAAIPGNAAPKASGVEAPEAAFSAEMLDRGRAIDLGYLGRVFEALAAKHPDLAALRIRREGKTLVLSVPHELLFTPGAAELTADGARAMFTLGGVVSNIGNAVDVVGHADPAPAGSRWASNWELSLARAQAVAAALRGAGYLREITVRGHGDGRFAEVSPWATDSQRRAQARRVDLVVREHGSGR